MEKENEVIENLFEESTVEVENNAFADLPPVAPVNYEEETVEKPVEAPVLEQQENNEEVQPEIVEEEKEVEQNQEITEVNLENLSKEVLEHPDAKIKLNNEKDEEIDKKELEELKDVKLMDNSSLKFVLILGLILLVVIFLIPVVSEYI